MSIYRDLPKGFVQTTIEEQSKEIDALKAEINNREGEKLEMREVIDLLKDELKALKNPSDARCMEIVAMREALKQERERAGRLREALEKIKDGGLPPGVLGNTMNRILTMCSIASEALLTDAKLDEGNG